MCAGTVDGASKIHCLSDDLMLGQHRKQWASIEPSPSRWLVFTGYCWQGLF